ncbi:nucleotide exchange factor GrpE [Hymenobacter sp. ASUV-10]|uniref:Protein GrpE n=1 Tax=Hymenobacter aranciens TaxID=3063996 RepID=A0ABT9B7C6_9BACT|nr:nucleotide exchange factor GrpE [Hymenobacter sp. ASUV-10]MDO7874185.1 nucleotide exchange factor GrpE [Hymenobacter sp. ASUV-10]
MADEQNLPQDDNLSADSAHTAGEMADADGENTDPGAAADASASAQPEAAGTRAEAELADLKDKYLRLAAEFENYKRRTTKERIDLFKTANQELMVALLPVLDDFDRARNATATTTDANAVRESIDIIQTKLNKTLQQKGLTAMEAKGGDFDAELHEAITQIPAPSDDLKGKIVDEVEKGYYLGDKVIRHAKVVLGQ